MPIKVFAVDDSATIRQTMKLTLRGEEFEVETANDGADALAKAQAGYVPDIVLTDVNMPNMDGITLTAELRKLPSYASIPIIMVTTESQVEKKQAGKNAGATGWIVKPFSPEQLIALVKKVAG
ncbi:MAG: response regulator [Planctomycetes bacterium]|nr:response regulator [Planctomycetota bacterium]